MMKMEKEELKMSEESIVPPKPKQVIDLQSLLSLQSSEGFWSNPSILNSIPSILKEELGITDDKVFLTLLALWLL